MKSIIFIVLSICSTIIYAQNLQLHYDFRHSIDPTVHSQNYPSFSFEYFKIIDTAGTGSFLLKIQTDLNGENSNAGQVFTQISQSIKFWDPKVYLSFKYSGGLGVTTDSYGYFITNSFGIGVSYPWKWKGAWLSANLILRSRAFKTASYDPEFTFYFGKGFLDYKIFIAGSFVFWTENKNQGTNATTGLSGKRFAFFGDPQIWFSIADGFSAGSRINVYYHILNLDDRLRIYPTLGLKYQF